MNLDINNETMKKYIYNISDLEINNVKDLRNEVFDFFEILNEIVETKSIDFKIFLKEIANEFNFDRVFIIEYHSRNKRSNKIHEYFNESSISVLEQFQGMNQEILEIFIKSLSQKKFLFIPDTSEFLTDFELTTNEILNNSILNNSSVLYFPIYNKQGDLSGIIGFENNYKHSKLKNRELIFINYLLVRTQKGLFFDYQRHFQF